MSNSFKLDVYKRDEFGSHGVKNLRKEGKVPGIYYSSDNDNNSPFYILDSDLSKAFKSGAHLYQISVGKKLKNVIFKEIQYHPVTDKIIHIDLYGVSLKDKIEIKVPLVLTGSAKGVSVDGGILTQSLNDLDIKCLPTEIPEKVEVDISDLGINESFYVKNIPVQENIEIIVSLDQVVASVTPSISDKDLVSEKLDDGEYTFDEDQNNEASKKENNSSE